MKKELTYSEAFSKLEELIEELTEGDVQLDKLTSKVTLANELIDICETKLRSIDSEVEEAVKTATTGPKKKNSR